MNFEARSPVFSHVSTTLSGLTTVRAFSAENTFEKQFFKYQNDHTSIFFLFLCTSRGLSILMDWICILYIASVALFLMLFGQSN